MENWIILIGIVLFFILSIYLGNLIINFCFNYINYKIKEIRNKDPRIKKEKELKEDSPSGMLGNLIGGFIVVVVGVSFLPTIASQFESYSQQQNLTGAGETVTGLVPLFFTAGIIAAGIAITVGGLRRSGVM